MEEASRLHSSRGGFRAHVTRTYARIAKITESTTPVTPAQGITLVTSLEILYRRKEKSFEGIGHKDYQSYTRA